MQPQTDAVLIYSTFPSADAAETVGRALVEGRLVACANVLAGITSIYEWNGAIQRDEEVAMILKTSRARVAEVIEAVKAGHPYDVPAIVALDVTGGHVAYLDWIASQTAAPGRGV